ncbi:unnamed protein product, partial [Schistocephalus solidus]|uniref:WAPL domain-containing protein n=1 Tax=Schistocephalus solidus TaxID=70667 RepID=A0A183T569_SCHSO
MTFTPTSASSMQGISLNLETQTNDSTEHQGLTPRECTLTSPIEVQPLLPPCTIFYCQPKWQYSVRCPVQMVSHTAFCCSRTCSRIPCKGAYPPGNTAICSPTHLAANRQEVNEKYNCDQRPRHPVTSNDRKKPPETVTKLPTKRKVGTPKVASDGNKVSLAKSSPKLPVKLSDGRASRSSRVRQPSSQQKVKMGKDESMDSKKQPVKPTMSAQEKSYLSRSSELAQGSKSSKGSIRPKETSRQLGRYSNIRDVKGPSKSVEPPHTGKSSSDDQASAAPCKDEAKKTSLNPLFKTDEKASLGKQADALNGNDPEAAAAKYVEELEVHEVDGVKEREEADNEESIEEEDMLMKLGGSTYKYDPSATVYMEQLPSSEEGNLLKEQMSSLTNKGKEKEDTLEEISMAFNGPNSAALLTETTGLDDLVTFQELKDNSIVVRED